MDHSVAEKRGDDQNDAPNAKSNNDNNSNNSNNSNSNNHKLTVTRFLIQNLRGKQGYAPTDFYMDLILEKQGLYHLVSTVFDILLDADLSEEGMEAHLWSIELAGTTFKNGWRHRKFSNGTFDRPANPNEVDDGELRILSSLDTALENGQKGKISGESLSCDIVVQDVSLTEVKDEDVFVKVETLYDKMVRRQGKSNREKEEEEEDVDNTTTKPRYPQITKIPSTFSGSVEDDWIEATEQTQCAQLQNAWNIHYQSYNSWKMDHYSLELFPAKPLIPEWGPAEKEIMGLLINSKAPFKKCWTNILQYAFPNRTEGGASQKWYQLKNRHYYMIKWIGENMTSDEARIQLAKRLAKKRLKHFIEQGVPKREPNPDIKLERELRKRGKLDDNTPDPKRRMLFAMCRGLYGVGGEVGDSFLLPYI